MNESIKKIKEEIEHAILSHEDKMAYRLAIKKRIKREKANDNGVTNMAFWGARLECREAVF